MGTREPTAGSLGIRTRLDAGEILNRDGRAALYAIDRVPRSLVAVDGGRAGRRAPLFRGQDAGRDRTTARQDQRLDCAEPTDSNRFRTRRSPAADALRQAGRRSEERRVGKGSGSLAETEEYEKRDEK